MSQISRAALIGRLNDVCSGSLRAAANYCAQRGNPYVELVHWIHQLYGQQDTDLHHVLGAFEVDEARFSEDLVRALQRLPGGASSVAGFSPIVDEAVKNAWVWASLRFDDHRVRSAHLLIGILNDPSLSQALSGISPELAKVAPGRLVEDFDAIVGRSAEAALSRAASDGAPSPSAGPASEPGASALERFTVDWTAQAESGAMDPVVGRDDEIRQIVDILMRRRQNNPLLTGEAGVGKTAVVEGFAQRIARGDVPPALQQVRLHYLDVGLMQAGASVKGEFEKRLRQLIDEVQASERPIILFVDETHTLVGAGGSAGTGDAANLLKPALARGTLRTIGATTWSEYKKYIEKDPALTRRFQVVQVDEPDEARAVRMLRGIVPVLEYHHRVVVLDDAIEQAVALSHRYIPARQLPDKAVSLLDTASARVGVSQYAVPAELDDCRKRIESLEAELEIVLREGRIGLHDGDRQDKLQAMLAMEREREQELASRWEREAELVRHMLELQRSVLEGDGAVTDDAALEALAKARAELLAVQGEMPLVLPQVDGHAVASVVADWTGIPVGRMVRDQAETVLNLADILGERVVGQRHAHEAIVKRLQTSRAGLDNPNKPVGVFMLVGPSGVGKTETALALAEAMYGGEQNLITINMSEFQEAHTVSTLKGAPPGYVGYGEGGVLTEAVRRKPYSVVLLDEVEKAHADVHEIFFQVFDKGQMEDGEGREIDFRNTLIILTTNVGSDLIMSLCEDPDLVPEPDAMLKALRKPLLDVFPPALLGRIVQIPFFPLNDEMIRQIATLQLERVVRRVSTARDVALRYTPAVIDSIASRCTELESGGRMIDNILTHDILPAISQEFLRRTLEGDAFAAVELDVNGNEFSFRFE